MRWKLCYYTTENSLRQWEGGKAYVSGSGEPELNKNVSPRGTSTNSGIISPGIVPGIPPVPANPYYVHFTKWTESASEGTPTNAGGVRPLPKKRMQQLLLRSSRNTTWRRERELLLTEQMQKCHPPFRSTGFVSGGVGRNYYLRDGIGGKRPEWGQVTLPETVYLSAGLWTEGAMQDGEIYHAIVKTRDDGDYNLCCNKVQLSPWKVSMIHENTRPPLSPPLLLPPSSSPPPTSLSPPTPPSLHESCMIHRASP